MKTEERLQEPKRLTILKNIFSDLKQAVQWLPSHYKGATYAQNCLEHLQRAETLIELLEVCDCGSVGGFDPVNVVDGMRPTMGLYDRFVWLVEKYHNKADIPSYDDGCSTGFTVDSLGRCYAALGKIEVQRV